MRYIGPHDYHHLRGLTRWVGYGWERGRNTWQMAICLRRKEHVIERHLHEYLHWKRTGNPAMQGVTWRPQASYNILCQDGH